MTVDPNNTHTPATLTFPLPSVRWGLVRLLIRLCR
jgi:hypothetical protein